MTALLVVAAIAVVALLLQAAANRRHQAQINAIFAAVASERQAQARERWDLNTRITSPEVVRAAPPAPPADAPPLEVLQALGVVPPSLPEPPLDPDDVDESFLVGTGPGEA